MSTKKSRLGAPPPIEETLNALHQAEVDMVSQHIRENPSIIEQSGITLERPAVEEHEPGPATPGGEASPAKGNPTKRGPKGSAKKEEKKTPLKQFNISIPEDLFFAIKGFSLEQRKSLQVVGTEILSDFAKRKLNKK